MNKKPEEYSGETYDERNSQTRMQKRTISEENKGIKRESDKDR